MGDSSAQLNAHFCIFEHIYTANIININMSDFYSKQIWRTMYDYVHPLELAHMGFHFTEI